MNRWLRVVLAAIFASVLLVSTGCDGDGEPSATGATTTDTTPQATTLDTMSVAVYHLARGRSSRCDVRSRRPLSHGRRS